MADPVRLLDDGVVLGDGCLLPYDEIHMVLVEDRADPPIVMWALLVFGLQLFSASLLVLSTYRFAVVTASLGGALVVFVTMVVVVGPRTDRVTFINADYEVLGFVEVPTPEVARKIKSDVMWRVNRVGY